MSEQPHFPIFVFGDNDAVVFLNQKDVGVFLEREDVADGTYYGFDYDGCALAFEVREDGIVHCSLASHQGQHDQLMLRLREHLAYHEEYQQDDNDAVTKALAVGVFVERHIEYPTFLGWLKSLIQRKSQ
ncbi:hypothetical protein ACR42D_01810 [Desulfovibrio caledoniensis]|jgi:hypothetical protein